MPKRIKAIHLIQKDPMLTPWPKIKQCLTEFETGYWDLTRKQANLAIGAEIYLHPKQNEPSFFGGIVTGFRIKDDQPWEGRIIFSLNPLPDFKGKRTSKTGWAMEMKIVYENDERDSGRIDDQVHRPE